MRYPEHIGIDKPVGVILDVDEYDINYVYTAVRDSANQLKENKEYYDTQQNMWSSDACVAGMFEMGYHIMYTSDRSYRNAVVVKFRHHPRDKTATWEFQDELIVQLKTKEDIPCTLHYKISYAIVSKEEGVRYKKISIAFYNEKDEMVITLKQAKEQRYGEVRSKAGKYMLSANAYVEKAKKDVAGGCFFCDYAKYVKDNGVFYIACTKYNGRVTEVDYTGEAYPEYCKRRV